MPTPIISQNSRFWKRVCIRGRDGIGSLPSEAMGAYALFGEADRFYKGFNGIEFERCEIETLANFVNKSVVFRRVGGGILVEILVWVAFKVAYYSASEEPMSLLDDVNPIKGQL